jgi:hypothetical protein
VGGTYRLLKVVIKLGVGQLAVQKCGFFGVIQKQSKTGNLKSFLWRQA